jgi:general stress protein 26
MFQDTHLSFLKDRIQDTRSALFYSLSNAVLKVPTSIVTALKVDDVGQVWFFIEKPRQLVPEFDDVFPARLYFYRKGKDYHLNVVGKACVVDDPEELNTVMDFLDQVKDRAISDLLLIKVKMTQIDYYESTIRKSGRWLDNLLTKITHWIHKKKFIYRPYLLNTGTGVH